MVGASPPPAAPAAATLVTTGRAPAAHTQALRGHAGGKFLPPGPPPRPAQDQASVCTLITARAPKYAALAPPASATAADNRDAPPASSQRVRRAHDHRQAPRSHSQAPRSNGAASPPRPRRLAGRAVRGPRRPSRPPSALGHRARAHSHDSQRLTSRAEALKLRLHISLSRPPPTARASGAGPLRLLLRAGPPRPRRRCRCRARPAWPAARTTAAPW